VVKVLSTLLKADGGTAVVNGYDVATQPAAVRASISLTGQFAAVDEVLTGRGNLVLIARLRHLDDPRAIADDLLARFDLGEAAGRRVATYSGGLRRRLDIAMDRVVAFIEADAAHAAGVEEQQPISDDLIALLDTAFLESFPCASRLLELLHERGWTGWTNRRCPVSAGLPRHTTAVRRSRT
jgi:ABC-type hemin transport system ATPase subunit